MADEYDALKGKHDTLLGESRRDKKIIEMLD